ncbi:Ni-sirohydrochlorin a,c-diamide reductive cyclase ATP-dependent reductase subunit [Methanobrevibacter sp. OttesenSCG-928-K11]|nr:Ni-sirohydrochlorin a,c-diamide reductive cyclase ATP-dependent reductase subunit [Methanobrevibacter sp. OttesenSCG-928-K11]MDL2271186.1 Ni-sirohydrochlorin a,c-diamide reductive cyclase ATP-dependent reductase subunit [Methanobrevibacter sp. OttesenSCG-928-I08]
MTKKIAIYGKGGIGKSTTVSNIAATYANEGLKTLVIGCDPKADTTRTLCGGRIPTVVNTLKENKNPKKEDLIFEGFNGVLCVESGGPEPGIGCAGRGVIVAMKRLENLDVFTQDLDVIIYDVLGDVVCGGFSVPLREKYADEVFIVSSGEYMSLYAANNISRGITKLKSKLSGIILNCKDLDNEEKIVNDFADLIDTKVIGKIDKSPLIQKSELEAKTVVERFPDSKETNLYKTLAKNILDNNKYSTPTPLDDEDLENFFKSYIF